MDSGQTAEAETQAQESPLGRGTEIEAEKDNTRAKGKVMAVQDARVEIAKSVKKNLEAEAEKTGGLRAGKASPPTNQETRQREQLQASPREQKQVQRQGRGRGLAPAV